MDSNVLVTIGLLAVSILSFGLGMVYALHLVEVEELKRLSNKAQREHADWHYAQQ